MGYRVVNSPAPGLMILLALLYLVPAAALEWQPNLFQNEEWWRLLTGHVVHLNGWHLLLNLTGLAILWLLYPHFLSLGHTVLAVLFSSLVISLGLMLLQPELPGYRGFSGCLHGLAAILAVRGWKGERVLSASVLTLLIGKLLMEATGAGLTDATQLIGGPVIWQAHWLGFSAGLLLAGLFWLKPQTPRQSSPE
ncbi:MAG: rhombosortase [Marinobacter excellens HL-55]|uniref:Rhombosortase n=1 Tax=Marinobacter excellens HL-55 TaxID=1305731 RepID=A0A0P8D0J0_9GAMM|nr:MAG: rhombosortase [Marinobacter excellens HL-55]